MNIIDSMLRIITPLKWGIKHGMEVGKGVSLSSRNGTSFGSEPYLIKLGDEVRISGGCTFVTHDGGTWSFRDLWEYKDVQSYGSIVVGNRTFIGYGAIIMPGVKIGSRCVIGAGAIVTRDVPDNSVAVGCPAKVVSSTKEYADKCLMAYKEFSINEIRDNKKEYLLELFRQGRI